MALNQEKGALEWGTVAKMLPQVRHIVGGLTQHAGDADDLVQEVMIRLLKTKAAPRVNVASWLSVVVRNMVADSRRDETRRSTRLDRNMYLNQDGSIDHFDEEGQLFTVSEGVAYLEPAGMEPDEQEFLFACVEALPTWQRVPLVLNAYGFSQEEIAKRTATNCSTVKTRICYARRKLAKQKAAYEQSMN